MLFFFVEKFAYACTWMYVFVGSTVLNSVALFVHLSCAENSVINMFALHFCFVWYVYKR